MWGRVSESLRGVIIVKRSASILYVMGSHSSDIKSLEQAIVLAKESQASVTVLDIVEALPRSTRMLITAVPSGELKNTVVAKRLRQIGELVSMIKPESIDLHVRVQFGNRAKEIVREAAAGRYDIVIKHPEKGRTDKYLSRHCTCLLKLLKADGSLVSGESLGLLGSLRSEQDKPVHGDIGMRAGVQSFAG